MDEEDFLVELFFDRMEDENERLLTFHDGTFPADSPVSPEDLAKAGFFCLSDEDRVTCAFCRGTLRDWEAGDVPIVEHLRHFPHC